MNRQMNIDDFQIIEGGGKGTIVETAVGEFEIIKFSNYEGATMSTVDESFAGFNEARFLTFSYNIPLISSLIKNYEYAEVILGCEGLVKNDVNSILALQMQTEGSVIDNLKTDKYLRQRIEDGTAHVYVLKESEMGISHQKVFLLKADDGRTRVIFGSANLTKKALDGTILEFIGYCDDRSLYNHLIVKYDLLRDDSSDEVIKKGEFVKPGETDIEDLPVVKRIKAENTIVVKHEESELDAKINYAVKVDEKWAKKAKEFCKTVKIQDDNAGYSLITSDHIKIMIAKSKEQERKKAIKQRNDPQYVIDYVLHSVYYNGIEYDLRPDEKEVKDSVLKLKTYMDGFLDRDNITGDVDLLASNMYKVANYMLLSPFMPKLVTAGLAKGFDNHSLPMYMLIQGPSDCGKSKLIEFLYMAMFGINIRVLGKDALSTSTNNGKATVPVLMTNVKGVPLCIDEMDGLNWKYAGSIFKEDHLKMEIGDFENRPCFLINTNEYDLKIPKDYSKRLACIYIDETTRFLEEFAAKNKGVVQDKINSMDTAMYREYVRRMFPLVDELIDKIEKPISEYNDKQWLPDIFNISSVVLKEMFMEYLGELPKGFSEFTWIDYMGAKARASKAIDFLIKDYYAMPDMFRPQKEKLYIDYSSRTKTLEKMKVELPVALMAQVVNNTLILDLAAAEEFTGIKFKRRHWWNK